MIDNYQVRFEINNAFLKLIRLVNRTKDQQLSEMLHDLSLDYERRPGEQCQANVGSVEKSVATNDNTPH